MAPLKSNSVKRSGACGAGIGVAHGVTASRPGYFFAHFNQVGENTVFERVIEGGDAGCHGALHDPRAVEFADGQGRHHVDEFVDEFGLAVAVRAAAVDIRAPVAADGP